ncbi:MAG: hypothetical protein EOO40_01580, partial [Deltaproteobacteria bacterium]
SPYSVASTSASPLSATMSQYATQISTLVGRQTAMQAEATLYNNVSAALQSLNQLTRTLGLDNAFAAPVAISSNTAVLGAQAGPSATPSSNSITVNQLASAQQNLSSSFASHSAAGGLGSGTLSITSASNPAVSFTVGASTSLDSLAASINAQASGVSASIVQDGSSYRIMLQGQNTGTSSVISFGQTGSVALGFAANQTQAAANANITFNGASLSSQTNTLTSLLPNTSINLVAASSTPVSLTVGTQPSDLTDKITRIVDAYNAVATALGAASSDAADGNKGGPPLVLLQLQRQLSGVVGGKIPGATGSFVGLAQLGVTSNDDGTVSLDSSALQRALSVDQASVQTLFNSRNGVLAQMASISDAFGNVATGALNTAVASLAAQYTDATDAVSSRIYNSGLTQQALSTQYQRFQAQMATLNAQNMLLNGAMATPLYTSPLYTVAGGQSQ